MFNQFTEHREIRAGPCQASNVTLALYLACRNNYVEYASRKTFLRKPSKTFPANKYAEYRETSEGPVLDRKEIQKRYL